MTQEEFNTKQKSRPVGWYFPAYSNATKYHYHATAGKSLCGRYGTFGSDHSDFSRLTPIDKLRCKTCFKKLNKK